MQTAYVAYVIALRFHSGESVPEVSQAPAVLVAFFDPVFHVHYGDDGVFTCETECYWEEIARVPHSQVIMTYSFACFQDRDGKIIRADSNQILFFMVLPVGIESDICRALGWAISLIGNSPSDSDPATS